MANTYSVTSGFIALDRLLAPGVLARHIEDLFALLVPREQLNGAPAPMTAVVAIAAPCRLGFALHSEGDSLDADDDAIRNTLCGCALACGADAAAVQACEYASDALRLCFRGTPYETEFIDRANRVDEFGSFEPTDLLDIAMRLPGGELLLGYVAQYGYYGDRLDVFSAGGSCSMAMRMPDGTIRSQVFDPYRDMMRAWQRAASGQETDRVVLKIRGGALQEAWSNVGNLTVIAHDEDLLDEVLSRRELDDALEAATNGLHEVEVEESKHLRAALRGAEEAQPPAPRG